MNIKLATRHFESNTVGIATKALTKMFVLLTLWMGSYYELVGKVEPNVPIVMGYKPIKIIERPTFIIHEPVKVG